VRGPVRLVGEPGPLLDAKAVLLVDDHEPEVEELDVFLEQRVRADDNPGVAGEDVDQLAAPCGDALRAGEQGHPGGGLRAAKLATEPKRSEQLGYRPVMLLREHLGRGEQRGLPACVHDRQHRPQRDHRLARPDLALKQAVHRVRPGEFSHDLLGDRLLSLGEGERQARIEGRHEPVGSLPSRHRCLPAGCRPAAGQLDLENEGLLPGEPAPRLVEVVPGPGPVNAFERLVKPKQAAAPPHVRRQRVGDLAQHVQRNRRTLAKLPGWHLRGRRVDRDQLV
jgi:hypothetical protein